MEQTMMTSKAVSNKNFSVLGAGQVIKNNPNPFHLDILELIIEDHRPLREIISLLKNSEACEFADRKQIFREFVALLSVYEKPKMLTLYFYMNREDQLREHGNSGDVKMMIVEQLIAEINETKQESLWNSRVNTLIRFIEKKINEEESLILPLFGKSCEDEDRFLLAQEYLILKKQMLMLGRAA